ncbi:ClpP/crotonase [Rhizopus microsporus var. microsporus]|uniref:3-hydroxyisobutyryl-CoA hydrolase n=2 Tax=Rhizopus microsporus TaxID=58291 RepID=A0A2G4SVN8_RHIZD|nr:ClpP/crotonase [Rhizopus microsporus ATCC 52813]ORE07654.1 ClpP/crotonase [Rhizopus microsporus var. microsporus]PHZ12802.1 ClpP/crotonase [Rhizopus microsporus ATCC 52813]
MSSRVLLRRLFQQSQPTVTRRTVNALPTIARMSMNANRRLIQTRYILSGQNAKKMYSTSSTSISGLESTQTEVIHKSNLAVREVILNRPKKLNALSLPMVRSILPELQSWEKSDLAKIILLKHSGGKGFCAGGDVKTVVDLAEAKDPNAAKFFEEEYQLDHLIATLETPFVSIMNGITMGGGVGLSVHAPFRIATENTLFAMPETAIGFLPEVGGSFFLPRLDGQLGLYLGLTGKRLKGVDVLYSGVATHYVPSSRLSALEARLAELEDPTHDMVNQAIEEFSAELEAEPTFSLGGPIRQAIDRCFKYDTIEEIIKALEKDEQTEWAQETLKLLRSMSPTSLKVTIQQIRNGSTLSISQCFKMEYHLVQKFLQGHDFKEGVYATLVRRDKANWKPSDLKEVDARQIKQDYFDSPSPLRLDFLVKRDYKKYPHRKYMLPSEQDIMRVVTGEASDVGNYALTRQQVIDYFVRERQGKQGVKQKVAEVLDRKTIEIEKDADKSLKWVYEV